MLGTVLLNFVLDPLFIFGMGLFDGLGVSGVVRGVICLALEIFQYIIGSPNCSDVVSFLVDSDSGDGDCVGAGSVVVGGTCVALSVFPALCCPWWPARSYSCDGVSLFIYTARA